MAARSGVPTRAAVVGTGLIGGSLLLALHRSGVDVTGWDPDRTTRQAARGQGVRCPDELTEAVADREVVFLCGPLPTLPETLLTVAAATGEQCVLTDVGSTKAALAAVARDRGLTHRVVPGHPMAGTDRAGIGAAQPALFDHAAWVLCPSAGPGLAAFRWLTALLVAVFRARVVPMSPDGHDAVVALASHVPHLLAGALAGAVGRAELRDAVLALAAGSFRDGTRVAGAPAERTANMLLRNRQHVLRELAGVRSVLDELAAALTAGDAAALTGILRDAHAARGTLLDPELVESHHWFPVDDGEAELAFLLGLGAAGGHLSRCQVTGAGVEYTAHKPGGAGHPPIG